MIEQAKAIVGGAIVRDESRGAHFKMDTPDRDDANWLKSTLAKWTPSGPVFEFEPVDCCYIPPRARKYRINQNKIVKEIMGEEALKGVGGS
jgi:succinate dehydrogenase / fumarate reductase flavoprotein subunit